MQKDFDLASAIIHVWAAWNKQSLWKILLDPMHILHSSDHVFNHHRPINQTCGVSYSAYFKSTQPYKFPLVFFRVSKLIVSGKTFQYISWWCYISESILELLHQFKQINHCFAMFILKIVLFKNLILFWTIFLLSYLSVWQMI